MSNLIKAQFNQMNEDGKTYSEYSFDTLAESVVLSNSSEERLTDKLAEYDAHTTNTENPHGVTKAQVGLGKVDNTADSEKPISTATQTALDGKSPLAGSSSLTTFSGGTFGDAAAKTVINSITDSDNLPTSAAVKAAIDAAKASVSSYLGTVTSITGLSTSATKGDYYRVSSAWAGVHVGDVLFAEKHNPEQKVDGVNWTLIHNESDTNTTYTFANGTAANTFTVTPSGGSAQTITITPAMSYNDLSDKPSLPTVSSLGLAAVATSGSYNDLSDKPTMPTVASLGLKTVATSGSYNDLTNKPNLSAVATTGSYNDLTDKPSVPTAESLGLKAVATSGSYNDLTDKPTIPDTSGFLTSSSDISAANVGGTFDFGSEG